MQQPFRKVSQSVRRLKRRSENRCFKLTTQEGLHFFRGFKQHLFFLTARKRERSQENMVLPWRCPVVLSAVEKSSHVCSLPPGHVNHQHTCQSQQAETERLEPQGVHRDRGFYIGRNKKGQRVDKLSGI